VVVIKCMLVNLQLCNQINIKDRAADKTDMYSPFICYKNNFSREQLSTLAEEWILQETAHLIPMRERFSRSCT